MAFLTLKDLEDLYTFHRENFMAKRKIAKKVARRGAQTAKCGVPTLEEVHECREELKFPEYVVLCVDVGDHDPEDYDEESIMDYYNDCTSIAGMYRTEEEAIEAAKKWSKGRYVTCEYRITKLHKHVKVTNPEPVIEVL